MKANVVVEYPVKSLDKIFTYMVPHKFESKIKVGMKVLVPFKDSIINGIVILLHNKESNIELKEIYNIYEDICLTDNQIKLAYFLKEKTLCPLISAFEVCLPPAIKINKAYKDYHKYESYIALNVSDAKALEYIDNNRYESQNKIIEDLLNNKEVLKKSYVGSSLNTLIKKGIIKEIKKEKYRINNEIKKEIPVKLNDAQKLAYEEMVKKINEYNTFLLEGVTGSGKTEVYMALIDNVLEKGKSAIVLVPEICLTTQTVMRFYKRFGDLVAVFHSALSVGEKYDEYQKIKKGEAKIVVGTRSSLFVPINNLGIIIIDEEHSESYKQETSPRYNAIEVATYLAKINNIPLVLSSATPSLESKARAFKGVYELVKLSKRANNKALPQILLVDMKDERDRIISKKLQEEINEKLLNNEQIILLLNRRGFATFVTCSNCGFSYKCPNCDITLTYHKSSESLRCHYCSYMVKKDELCPNCHEKSLNYLGLGTEKVLEKLQELFPNAKVVRMDQDTTTKKGSYQKIVDDFSEHKYDILLGTQMISKGLDFSNVTLVGIINADTSLNIPDFRSNEKTFDLLYQTSGRCGRGSKEGTVIIQTYNPDNKVLNYVKNNDYESFWKYELDIRHKLLYPPYTFLLLLKISSKDYDLCSKESNNIKKYLMQNLNKNFIVFGPAPASIFKINNVYNFQIIIKYTKEENLFEVLKKIDSNYILNNKVNLEITFNPSNF